MPQINISVAKKLSDNTKDALQMALADNISILPGKTKEKLAVCIIDDCSMYKNAQPSNGAFIEVRLFRNTTEQAKREFTGLLFDIANRILEIHQDQIYINYIELQDWGAGGIYKATSA